MIVLFLLLVISACGTQKNVDITNVDIRKGTDGLTMEFLKNAPPENVFEDGKFPVSIKLKNTGAFNIIGNKNTPSIEGGLLVFGFEKAYVDIKPQQVEISIEGKSVFNPKGGEDFVNSNAEAKKIGPQSEKHPSTILATACYPYKTILDTSICIDTDVLGQRRGQKSCIAKDLSFGEGQGAPVAITKIETRMLPQDNAKVKPHFIIHVKNAGNGQVIKNGIAEKSNPSNLKEINKNAIEKACSSESLSYKDFNVLNAKASLSGVILDCDPKEGMQQTAEIRIKDKEDIVRCTYEGDAKNVGGIDASLDPYTAQLKIELDYGYTFTISKDIIIEKVLTH